MKEKQALVTVLHNVSFIEQKVYEIHLSNSFHENFQKQLHGGLFINSTHLFTDGSFMKRYSRECVCGVCSKHNAEGIISQGDTQYYNVTSESNCDVNTGPVCFLCGGSGLTIPSLKVCDGEDDCHDGGNDEKSDLCPG